MRRNIRLYAGISVVPEGSSAQSGTENLSGGTQKSADNQQATEHSIIECSGVLNDYTPKSRPWLGYDIV